MPPHVPYTAATLKTYADWAFIRKESLISYRRKQCFATTEKEECPVKKLFVVMGSLLMLLSLLGGCRSSGGPANGNGTAPEETKGPELRTTEPTEASTVEIMTTAVEEQTAAATEETIVTEPPGPVEMTMEEIEAKLGFGYKLPAESEYEGTIICTVSGDTLAISYTSDAFPGRVVLWKSVQGETDKYDSWDQWAEAGEETLSGVQVRFRGNEPDHRGIAFWRQNGYQYILNCETAPGTDIMKILPIFMEEEILNPNVMTPMPMEELEKRLGFGWRLPAEGKYEGEIIPMIDPSIGENGGIALEYRQNKDAGPVYVWKYEKDPENDAYDTWQTDLADRGSERIQGVEVRFRGNPTLPDYKGVAYWQQNGFQYVLTCETSPFTDMMAVLPLFIESAS